MSKPLVVKIADAFISFWLAVFLLYGIVFGLSYLIHISR